MNLVIHKSLILLSSILCVNYFFSQIKVYSQTKVYDVKETTLHLDDSIVYLRSTMTPISGIIQEIDTNKKKVFEASFISGKKSGNLKLWLSNGQLILSGNYLKGLPHGSFEWYFKSGKIKAKCNYIEGQLNGKCQGWYENHGQLKYDENYQLGGLFGVQRYFSEYGVSLGGGDLVNGNGELVLNYDDNRIAVDNSYSNGKLNSYIEYSRKGDVLANVSFTKDIWSGKWSGEFWNGKDKIAQLTFLDGDFNGSRWLFHDNGKLSQEGYCRHGKLDSTQRFWYDNGKLKEESIWSMGEIVSAKYWNENGEIIANRPPGFYLDWPNKLTSDYGNIKLNMTHSPLFKVLFMYEFEEIIHSKRPSIPDYSRNPFGDGGNGGGNGGDNGPFDGNGKGTGGEGEGVGDGRDRIRINDPRLPKYNTEVDLKVHLKLTVDGEGNVVNAICIKDKTTTDDQTIINDLIRHVIRQVKYNKDPEGKSVYCYFSVIINAQ